MTGRRWLGGLLPGILLLTACDAPPLTPRPEPPKPVVLERPVEPPPPSGPTGNLTPWEVTRGRVGPLTVATPCTVEAVAKRFPDLAVEKTLTIRGDVGLGVIAVSDGQKRLLEIQGGDWITEIRVLERRFRSRGGRRIGQTWSQSGFRRTDCVVYPTWFDESTAIKCQDDRDPGLSFLLSIPKVALSRVGKGDVVQYDKAVVRTIDWSH